MITFSPTDLVKLKKQIKEKHHTPSEIIEFLNDEPQVRKEIAETDNKMALFEIMETSAKYGKMRCLNAVINSPVFLEQLNDKELADELEAHGKLAPLQYVCSLLESLAEGYVSAGKKNGINAITDNEHLRKKLVAEASQFLYQISLNKESARNSFFRYFDIFNIVEKIVLTPLPRGEGSDELNKQRYRLRIIMARIKHTKDTDSPNYSALGR